MPPIAHRLREQIQRMFTERAAERSWGHAIGLTVVTAVAYFLAARAGLTLLKPEGVAVMWPALGLAVGALIALGPDARAPVATGILAGIIAARLRVGGSFWIAIALGLCNTGGGLLTARLIERWFGPAFKLENVSCVLGFLGATAVGSLAAAISGTAVVAITEPTRDILNVWCGWFTSAALATGAFVMSLPPGPWATAVPVAVVFPIVLWIAVRCRPVFAASAAFIVALIVAYSTALNLGDFGDVSIPLQNRTLAAQTIVLAGALCLLILSALFAERREYETILEDGNRRLQLVLAQREEAERTLSDRNTQLALAGKVALVGSYAYDVNADEMRVSEGYAAIHGLPEGTAETTRSAWRTRVHPEDIGRVERHRRRALRVRACEHTLEYRIVLPDRGVRWIESRSFISYDGKGCPQRAIGVNIDVTDRKQTEARLSDALAAGQVVAFEWDAVTGRSQRSDNADRVIGFVEDGRFLKQVHPDYRDNVKALVRSLCADKPSYSTTFQFIRSDGRQVWQEETGKGEFDRAGRLIRIKGLTRDITERKRAELALADRNTQLALAGKAGLVATFAYDVKTDMVQISEGYAEIYGFPEGTTQIARSQWRTLVFPDDLERLESLRAQAFADRQREYGLEYRIILTDGGVRWIETRSFALYDGEGRPQRVVGVNIDITERKRAEEARKILNAELDHRVKNTLATVSAVMSHTLNASSSMAEFATALDGRLQSMARTHDLLSATRWQGISVAELVRRELAPYATTENAEINGPEVSLRAEAGQVMAMVLHELVTNAAKYGALSTSTGQVSVRWHLRRNGQSPPYLVLEWQEIGGPPVARTGKPSYGTSTICDLIPYEFCGSVDLVNAPDGVRCHLELPG